MKHFFKRINILISIIFCISFGILLPNGSWALDLREDQLPFWKEFTEKEYPIWWNFEEEDFLKTLPKPKIIPTQKYTPGKTFMEFTQKGADKIKLGPNEELYNHVAGLPFPKIDPKDPQAGTKIMWNYEKTFFADDFIYPQFKMYYINKKGEVERVVGGDWIRLYTAQRTVVPPIPHFPEEYKKHILFRDLILISDPRDLEGFGFLETRYYDNAKYLTGAELYDYWSYLPSIRRIRRLSAAQRSDSFLGATYSMDDARGYDRQILGETYRLIGETELYFPTFTPNLPIKINFHPKNKRIWIPEAIQKRKIWIVEGKHKDPNYVYSRSIYYLDKEMNMLFGTENYDRAGKLWRRIHNNYRVSPKGNPVQYGVIWLDVQSEKSTVIPIEKDRFNENPYPRSYFSLHTLEILGH